MSVKSFWNFGFKLSIAFIVFVSFLILSMCFRAGEFETGIKYTLIFAGICSIIPLKIWLDHTGTGSLEETVRNIENKLQK